MKKLFVIAAMCMSMTAQATVLRVSNVPNSGAPYTSISDAMTAAADGDTIIVDGSAQKYDEAAINKRIVLMGPGYWLAENGTLQDGASPATVGNIYFNGGSDGTIVTSMECTGTVYVKATNVTITRCKIDGNIIHDANPNSANHTIIHQCFLGGYIRGYGNIASHLTPSVQVTNNIFTKRYDDDGLIEYLTDSYIAYNTMTNNHTNIHYTCDVGLKGCTIEKNVAYWLGSLETCTYSDNFMQHDEGDVLIYPDTSTDFTIKNQELSADVLSKIEGKGAFAGDDPYVISGLPVGPVIKDISVPASVTAGSSLNVTIKLGVQR